MHLHLCTRGRVWRRLVGGVGSWQLRGKACHLLFRPILAVSLGWLAKHLQGGARGQLFRIIIAVSSSHLALLNRGRHTGRVHLERIEDTLDLCHPI